MRTPAEHAAYMREYMKDPVQQEKKRVRDAAYREANRDKIRDYMGQWYQDNRQKAIDDSREHTQLRRDRVKDSQRDSGISVPKLRARDGDCCSLCGKPMDFEIMKSYNPNRASVDHTTPLINGGTHTWDNVTLTHLRCNLSKGAKV